MPSVLCFQVETGAPPTMIISHLRIIHKTLTTSDLYINTFYINRLEEIEQVLIIKEKERKLLSFIDTQPP